MRLLSAVHPSKTPSLCISSLFAIQLAAVQQYWTHLGGRAELSFSESRPDSPVCIEVNSRAK
jgi:hypothetical protein